MHAGSCADGSSPFAGFAAPSCRCARGALTPGTPFSWPTSTWHTAGLFLASSTRALTSLTWCREKLGWLINSVASVVFVILVIIVFAKYHHTWSTSYYGPY